MKRRIGMDDDRSWIVIDEINMFLWPGPDLAAVPGREPPTVAYGFLPIDLFAKLKQRLAENIRRGGTSLVPRDE